MKKSKYQQYFRCFSVCILVPYAFCFSFQQNIVTILISTVFRGAALIRGEALISMWIPKGFFYIVKKNNHRCGAYLRLIANFLISLLLRILLSCLVIYISNFWESLRTILAPRKGLQLFFLCLLYQRSLNQKKMQLNLCGIFSIVIFNELPLIV